MDWLMKGRAERSAILVPLPSGGGCGLKTCPGGQQHTFGFLVVGCSVETHSGGRIQRSPLAHDSPRGLGTCSGGRIQRIPRPSSGRMQRGDLFRWPKSACFPAF
jgi:hypothetical protein